jgi:hypothetical protein
MRYLFILLSLFSLRAAGQAGSTAPPPASPFEVRELNTTPFHERELGYTFIRDTNIICYQDTLSNSDTVRIAYRTASGRWLSFPTPFARQFLRTHLQFVDLDNDKQPELIVNGDASFQTWPRGDAANYLTVIFKLDRVAKIVFQCTSGCWVSNFGGRYKENPIDFGIGRYISTDSTGLLVGPLKLSELKQPNEKNAFKEFCRLTEIKSGIYKFENGQFVRKEENSGEGKQ